MAKKQAAKAEGDDEKKKGGKGKILVVVGCVALGAGGYMLGGGGAADPAADAAHATTTTLYQKPGCTAPSADSSAVTVVAVPSMSINLADGHYLRVAISLGLCDDIIVTEAAPFIIAPAQDILLETLSGQSMDTLSTPAGRDGVKEQLNEEIVAAYAGEVFEIYLVEFVMQ